MFRITFPLLLIIPILTLRGEPPAGRAEMPLTEWKQTLERLRLVEDSLEKSKIPLKNAAPVPAIIHSVFCEANTDAEAGSLTLIYEVECLAEGWSILPLTDDALPLEVAQTSGGRVIHHDGKYALLTDGPIRAKVSLTFDFPGNQATLLLPDTLSARLQLTSSNPKSRLQAGSLIIPVGNPIALSVRERHLTLRLLAESEAEVEKTVVLPPSTPGNWQTHPETLVHYEDGRLNFSSRVVLWCVTGDERLAHLELPPLAMLLAVEGEDLQDWKVTSDQKLRVEWKTGGQRQHVLALRYTVEHKNLLNPWPLLTIHSLDDQEKSGVWSVRLLAGLHFAFPAERPIAATLSTWLNERTSKTADPIFSATPGFQLAVETIKTLALPDAGISTAKYTTRLSRGGGLLTEATLEISHPRAVGVEFQLPKETRLVSCKIHGTSHPPVDLGDGRIRLDLPAGAGTTSLQLSYAGQSDPLPPANGKIHLDLLSSPLLTDQIEWAVLLPDDLALDTFEGSVTAVGGGSGLRFRQELNRETAPWVDLFYQKKLK